MMVPESSFAKPDVTIGQLSRWERLPVAHWWIAYITKLQTSKQILELKKLQKNKKNNYDILLVAWVKMPGGNRLQMYLKDL